MKVIKATDSTVNAIRKMESVSRSLVSRTMKKQSSFFAESSSAGYSGPFMVIKSSDTVVTIKAPPEFMGNDTGYAGSICAPDMQILAHIGSANISYSADQKNTLLVLKVTWSENGIRNYEFLFVPDPWNTCSDLNRMITIDFLNPKTEEFPHRNPFIAIYPIARIVNGKILQIQQGHIVEYNRWWRS